MLFIINSNKGSYIKMRILIYDDEKNQCNELKTLLREELHGDPHIDCVNSIAEARKMLSENSYSIIFIDIELDSDQNGIELATEITKNAPSIRLVFITGYLKYCEKIFSADPDALLLKPFSRQSIRMVLDIIRQKNNKKDIICIPSGKRTFETIELDGISYIETQSRHLIFYDNNYCQVFNFYDIKLSEIADKLPDNFVRCHKSFFVNMRFVSRLERYKFLLKGNREIPISRKCSADTKRIFLEFLEDVI